MRALLLWRAPNPPFLFIFENLFLQQLSSRGCPLLECKCTSGFFINVAEISSVAHILGHLTDELIKSFRLFPSL